jgi:hypothetical protein
LSSSKVQAAGFQAADVQLSEERMVQIERSGRFIQVWTQKCLSTPWPVGTKAPSEVPDADVGDTVWSTNPERQKGQMKELSVFSEHWVTHPWQGSTVNASMSTPEASTYRP